MAIEEEKWIEVEIKSDEPVSKPIELKNIGFLRKEPTYVNCPACEATALSTVRPEAVTCLQRFLNLTQLCKNSESRADINHYCSRCGCFIGRYVSIGCVERSLSRSARRKAAEDKMSLKTRPKDCAASMQKIREHIRSQQANKKAKREAGREAEEKAKVEEAQ